MAEIALSLVTRLIQVISVLAEKEASLLRSVPENTRYIKDELETIGAFLGDGLIEDIQENNNPKYRMVRPWADQVKDLAYDMEDCLEERIIVLTHNSSWSQKVLNYKSLHHFAAKLSDLRSRIVEVSERNRRYHLVPPYESTSSNMTIRVVLDHMRSRFFKGATQNEKIDDLKEEVGSRVEVPRESALAAETSNGVPKVVAIAGMSGSGTSLAREIYDKNKVHFSCHAWIKLSQVVDVTKVFKDMIEQLFSFNQAGYISEEEKLAHHIQDDLKCKRFLIVFYGVWISRAWIRIKRALPRISKSGSWVIVTTEITHVARDCMGSDDHVYFAPLLSERESLKLLKDSVLQSEKGKLTPEDKEDFQDLDLDSLKESKLESPFDTIAKVLMKCGGAETSNRNVCTVTCLKAPTSMGKIM